MTALPGLTPPDPAPVPEQGGAPSRRRRPALRTGLAVGGVALVTALGASAAWVASATTVTLSVDGQAREVTTHGDTVADVLAAQDLQVGEHDVLSPAADREVSDGDAVALRRGRELQLVVDGVARTVWVTADDVDEALEQVGLRAEGAVLSASRSRAIGLEGLTLDVRLPKQASITVDGATTPRTTTAATVGDLLAEAGVVVRPSDTTDLPVATPVTEGLAVRVVRHDTREDVEEVPVAVPVVRTEDAGAYAGTERVVEAGRAGVERRTWAVALVDGVEAGRTLVSAQRTTEPVARRISIGTAPRPAPPPPAPRPAAAVPPAPRPAAPAPSGGSGLDWAALARCESGGDPRAVSGNGLYYGLYQFSLGTWRSVGGSGSPAAASPAEQTARAQALYARTGPSSWPTCGRHL